jgi:hypothetical protein
MEQMKNWFEWVVRESCLAQNQRSLSTYYESLAVRKPEFLVTEMIATLRFDDGQVLANL